MVSFAEPRWLILLVLPVLAVLLAALRHRRRIDQQRRLAAPAVWSTLVGGMPATGLLRLLAWSAAAALIAVAVARPQWGELPNEASVRTRDVVVALDLSDSMLCEDLRPSRLARSVETIQRLLPALEGNRLAVVIFAGEAYPLVPLTSDLGAVAVFLEGVQPGMVALPGSNLERAVDGALELLPEEGEARVLLLFTDGENLQGDVQVATARLDEAGIRMLGVVAGTESGGPIPEPDGRGGVRYKRDRDGRPVVTRAHPQVLRGIADAAGGEVVLLGDPEVTTSIASAVDRLQTREVESTRTMRRIERFPILLAAAAAFAALGFALSPWRRAATASCLLLAVSATAGAQQDASSPPGPPQPPAASVAQEGAPWWQRVIPGGSRRLARQGAAGWERGDVESAIGAFAGAAELAPERPERLYDLGTALAAAGALDEASPLLEAADRAGVSEAAYNSGTAALSGQQLEQAIHWLRRAMLADPDDLEAKHNYELALRLRQQQQEQQQQQQEEQQEQQDEDEQQQEPGEPEQPPPPRPGPSPTPNLNQPLYAALDRAEAEAREAMRSPTPAAGAVEKDW